MARYTCNEVNSVPLFNVIVLFSKPHKLSCCSLVPSLLVGVFYILVHQTDSSILYKGVGMKGRVSQHVSSPQSLLSNLWQSSLKDWKIYAHHLGRCHQTDGSVSTAPTICKEEQLGGSFLAQAAQNGKGDKRHRASEDMTELSTTRCRTRRRRKKGKELRTKFATAEYSPLMDGRARYCSCVDEGGNGGRMRAARSLDKSSNLRLRGYTKDDVRDSEKGNNVY